MSYVLYRYGNGLYIGRTYQLLDARITGHIYDALNGSNRLICQQIRHDIKERGEEWVRKQFTIVAMETSHDQLCALETSEIRRCRPLLNMTKPKTRAEKTKVTKSARIAKPKTRVAKVVTKSVKKNMIKKPPILKKHEKKYIKNKPKQIKYLIDKASFGQTFKNKQERLNLVKRISNQYPDWD